MGIKGDVRSLSLANVLQDLAMNEQTGTLTIRHKDRQLGLWFERGALRLVGLGPGEGPSLLNGLLALEKISPDEAPAVTGRRTSEGAFIRGLAKKGRVTRDDLRAALEHQMGEHLCDAFLWTEATFEFEEGQPDDRLFDVDQLDYEPRLAADGVIMEALRRADEWSETRKAILSSNEILVPDPPRVPHGADPTVRRLLALLDGERTLRDIQDLTRLGQFVLLRAAALLLKSGGARPLSAAEAFERARARSGRKEWEAALRMAQYGLDHERKNTGLLEVALRCTEELQNHDAAASFARQLASAQVESGQLELAVKSYRRVLSHAPRDIVAHERLFGIMLQLDLKLDALEAGEALAAAYKKAGLPDKALAVYQRLIEKVGDHRELLESVAEIQRHLGDKAEAVKLYAKLLAKAREAKNDGDALDLCRTILKIDPRHAEAQRLRAELESGQVQRARRRRRLVQGVVVVAVLTTLVFTAVLYEYGARRQYLEVRDGIDEAVRATNYREALRLYDLLLDGYRWSLKAREERDMRDKREGDFAQQQLELAEKRKREGDLLEAARIIEEAQPMLRRGDLRGKTGSRLAELRDLRSRAEETWSADLARMTPEQIMIVKEPLAVPALGKLLSHTNREIRSRAVQALANIKGDAATAALLAALADADPAIRDVAARTLVKWEKTPFRATLSSPRPAFGPGETMTVEWRVTNLSPAEVELTLKEAPTRQLEVKGPTGPIKLPQPSTGPRTERLGPGEYVGGPFPDLMPHVGPQGRYKFTWSVALLWSGDSFTLSAPPLTVERTR